MSSYEVLIRESHVDSLGHLNNATYLALFEEARWEMITPKGYGFNEIQKFRQGPVILDVHLKFLAEIGLREKIKITTQLLHYKNKIGQLEQKMIKDDGRIASEAVFTFGLFDLNLRKLIEPTEAWKKALEM